MSEHGSVSVMMIAVVGLVMVLMVATVDVARYLDAHIQAATAADAAALAAAPVTFRPFGATGSPAREAGRYAAANGAKVVRCQCARDESFNDRGVVVVVRLPYRSVLLGEVAIEATGRAEFRPSLLAGFTDSPASNPVHAVR